MENLRIIDFHELLMERKFCVIFPKYKNTKYVQNNCHLKKIVIFKKSHHAVTKLDTLLCGTGHIYICIYIYVYVYIYVYIYTYTYIYIETFKFYSKCYVWNVFQKRLYVLCQRLHSLWKVSK